MDTLPLHPALVHLPLGIAFLLPLLGLGLLVAIIRGWLPRSAWAVLVLTSVVALGSAFAAAKTGERDEERVEKIVGQAAFERHEDAAHAFILALGLITALSAGSFFLKKDAAFRVAMAVLSLAYFGVMAMGMSAGRHGGELVYKLGAAGPGPAPTVAPVEHHD